MGYRPTPLNTGYDQVLSQRTDDLFATTAEQKGKVLEVSPKAVVVEYDDGLVTTVELGRRYGKASGAVIPHEVVSPFVTGDRVEVGDCIAYNRYYFEPDPLSPRHVLYKAGVILTTALLENNDTFEDSSALTASASGKMTTMLTYIRELVVDAKQIVHDVVEVGSEVRTTDILCTIEDPVGDSGSLYDADTLDTLKMLSANNPRAKHHGRIERVEVFYHADLEDLSPSLQELAVASDRMRKREARALKRPYYSGRVDDSYRVEGTPLAFGKVVIVITMTDAVGYAAGDKCVFANQAKTVTGAILSGRNESESGEQIDAFFSYSGFDRRMIRSPILMGITNRLLRHASKRVAGVYYG